MAAKTPEECDRLFARYVNARDLDALIQLYEPTACLVQQDGRVDVGHDAIRKALGALEETPTTIQMEVVKVIRSGEDLAVLYNDWSLEAEGPAGSTIEMSSKAIEVVRRQADGSWRFAVDDPYARD